MIRAVVVLGAFQFPPRKTADGRRTDEPPEIAFQHIDLEFTDADGLFMVVW